jgi:thaumarchaeosortase
MSANVQDNDSTMATNQKKQLNTRFMELLNEFRTRDAIPLLVIVSPILFLIVMDPLSFTLVSFVGREIGRAGFVFVFFLVAWDWHDSRAQLHLTRAKWRYVLAGLVLVGLIGFYCLDLFYTDPVRVYVTSQLGVSQKSTLSFLVAMEYMAYALYCLIITAILYSPRKILLMVTPVIYAIGNGILASLDAYFPENALPPLQIWVPTVWNLVVLVLRIIGFHATFLPSAQQCPMEQTLPSVAYVPPNVLCIYGLKGFVELVIFWPSSGIVSMIIYSLVIVVLMVKLDAPRKRKLIYASIGAVGTFFVNVFRITLIVLYATYVSSAYSVVDAFHNSIGDILFIIWIFSYLLLVIHMENTWNPVPKPPTTARPEETSET